MSLNAAPSANRVHIAFFGKRNAGKSSLLNAVTGQDLALVSEVKGTTTDPVYKAMELLPLGPVVMIDTPGMDDEGPLGNLRVDKALQVLRKTDVAVLVVDASVGKDAVDDELLRLLEERRVPYIVALNKCDVIDNGAAKRDGRETEREILLSAKDKINIDALKEKIARLAAKEEPATGIVEGIVGPSDCVVLVTPIDAAAPKGRLILPQQQTIRDILDTNAAALVVQDSGLSEALSRLAKKPALVITDSQVFAEVAAMVPPDIPLTSFSILFARHKGGLENAVAGAKTLDTLRDKDTVLISEGCTHHRQCEDIGTVKLPRWIRAYTEKNIEFAFSSGTEFPNDLSPYSLVIHCGGCMLNNREMQFRQAAAANAKVPITNYGIAIAFMQGILKRSVAMFPRIARELD
ncbi:MAG: [FeFe] hydrogenase H-cluster maturation GTPase HydF [Spirochaetaceae bacterium]|nr:[FeFe] hydrogenase H-cluster maturation GTPase HydF [Spirochaetaceae bacterium]